MTTYRTIGFCVVLFGMTPKIFAAEEPKREFEQRQKEAVTILLPRPARPGEQSPFSLVSPYFMDQIARLLNKCLFTVFLLKH